MIRLSDCGGLDERYRVRYDRVDGHGVVTLRYDSRLRHIGLGARHRGKAIVLFVADREVRIVGEDGELLRQLVLDPARTTSTSRPDVYDVLRHRLRCPDTSQCSPDGIRTHDLFLEREGVEISGLARPMSTTRSH